MVHDCRLGWPAAAEMIALGMPALKKRVVEAPAENPEFVAFEKKCYDVGGVKPQMVKVFEKFIADYVDLSIEHHQRAYEKAYAHAEKYGSSFNDIARGSLEVGPQLDAEEIQRKIDWLQGCTVGGKVGGKVGVVSGPKALPFKVELTKPKETIVPEPGKVYLVEVAEKGICFRRKLHAHWWSAAKDKARNANLSLQPAGKKFPTLRVIREATPEELRGEA